MPIYEYQCTKCEHKMEALQKISEASLLECPACGTENLKKLVSAASFRLKGGGWYETDFKTGDKKQLAESESATPNSTESSTSDADKPNKSDSDSAAKTPVSTKDAGKGASKASKDSSNKASKASSAKS